MNGAILWSYFKDEGVTIEDISAATGYGLRYILDLLEGRRPLNDRAKFRIVEAFPATADLLLNGEGVGA